MSSSTRRVLYGLVGVALGMAPARTVIAQVGSDSMKMPPDSGMPTAGTGPLGVPMQRTGSGTSWQPDATMMRGVTGVLWGWQTMLHGSAFLEYDDQGSPRGSRQFGSINWGMAEASRSSERDKLSLRLMMSAEPFTVGRQGYPLLLQSGEAYRDMPLHDRQHPHDLFMEIAAMYEHALTHDLAASLYFAPAGEPAIGPVAFPHRESASNDPMAPIGHHWQDATHVSFGVITAGLFTRAVRLETSLFNGREPDDIRTNLDFAGRRLDSYAGRLTVIPDPQWAISGSYAFLASPEQLDPHVSVHRYVASVMYTRPVLGTGQWASTAVFGANRYSDDHATLNGALIESNVELDGRNALFVRAEWVQKSASDLAVETATQISAGSTLAYNIGEATAGYVRNFMHPGGGELGIGAAASVNAVPGTLEAIYGSRTPVGGMIFLRFRPGFMNMKDMSVHQMKMESMSSANRSAP